MIMENIVNVIEEILLRTFMSVEFNSQFEMRNAEFNSEFGMRNAEFNSQFAIRNAQLFVKTDGLSQRQ